MATTTIPQVVLLTDPSCILIDPSNIRPLASIEPARICQLAGSIHASQRNGGGYFMTGIEQPIIVYTNGDGSYHLPSGQERWLAVQWLIGNQPDYQFIGIPAEIRDQPADLWESTRLQMAIHDVDPVNIIDLTRRAVELYNTPTPTGQHATWGDVCQVMGKSPADWSHHQHLLALIPELQDGVLTGKLRGQTAAYIGRDLPEDLQRQHLAELLVVGKDMYRTRALIQRILDAQNIAQALEDDDEPVEIEDIDETDDEPQDDDEPAPDAVDAEAQYLVRQAIKIITRLELLAGDGRLEGLEEDLNQIGERFLDLETL